MDKKKVPTREFCVFLKDAGLVFTAQQVRQGLDLKLWSGE